MTSNRLKSYSTPTRLGFRAFWVTLFIFLTGIGSAFAEAKYEKRAQQQFQALAQSKLETTLKELSVDVAPHSAELAKELMRVRKGLKDIKFTKSFMAVTDSKTMSCRQTDDSIWISQGNQKTVVVKGHNGSGGSTSLELLVHESLGVMGVVDDEYQVSAPLMALQSLKKHGGGDPQDIHELIKNIQVERRKDTPTYKINPKESFCYGGNGLIKNEGGTSTGVGGGGNSDEMTMKTVLLLSYSTWWKERMGNTPIPASFKKAVLELGFEPLVLHGGAVFAGQLDFTFSKRTKKHVVRISLMDTIARNPNYQIAPIDRILTHLYTQTSSPRPFNYQHYVYGAILAGALGLVSNEQVAELQEKENVFENRLAITVVPRKK